jgi:rubrerythrin
MDFTNPFVGLTPDRKLTNEEILRALRIDLAAELDAINLYQAHIDAIDDERVKEVIAHIRDEEKEHAAEFMAIINFLDDKQREEFTAEHTMAIQQGRTEMITEETEASVGEASMDALSEVASADGSVEAPGFTVGSLLGEEQGK